MISSYKYSRLLVQIVSDKEGKLCNVNTRSLKLNFDDANAFCKSIGLSGVNVIKLFQSQLTISAHSLQIMNP